MLCFIIFIIYWYQLQVVKCILSLHWPTMLLLQIKSLTSQILLACTQGDKARCFLSWGKRKRTLNRVQYCLQIVCQAVRLSYGCYLMSYLPLPCALHCLLPYFWNHTHHFSPGSLPIFFFLMFGIVVSLLWACIASFPFVDMHFCTSVMWPCLPPRIKFCSMHTTTNHFNLMLHIFIFISEV